MKTCLLAIAALAVGLWASTMVAGDQAPANQPAAQGHRMGGPGRLGMGGGMPFAGLNLTDDQKAKIKEIMDGAKAAAEKATDREGKMKAIKDAFESIKTTVLTEDQQKKLEDLKGKFPGRPGMGGPGHGPMQQQKAPPPPAAVS